MRVFAFFPHPDDEAYSAAGTLHKLHAAGHTVQVVCATYGEGGGDAKVRARELNNACGMLGLAAPLVLGWPDGNSEGWPVDELDAALRAFAPEVVITLGRDGVYGHRDHLAATTMIGSLFAGTILHAVFPTDLFAPLRDRMRRLSDIIHEGSEQLGVERDDVDHIVDISSEAEIKRRAIACHASQWRNGSFLWPGLVEQLVHEEWFVHAGGPRVSLP